MTDLRDSAAYDNGLTAEDYRTVQDLFDLSPAQLRRLITVQMARIIAMTPAERAAAAQDADSELRRQAERAEAHGDHYTVRLILAALLD